MRILIADDDQTFRPLLEDMLVKWGYEVVAVKDGNEAWQAMQAGDAPRLAILDWMMPGMDGVEVCSKVRNERLKPYAYIILLTSNQRDEDLVHGMEAGADDYVTKPLKINELKARLNAGRRMIELHNELETRAFDLEAAYADLEAFSYTIANDMLRSLLSIGDHAKSIQDLYCGDEPECISYAKRIYEKTKNLGQLIAIMHDFFRPTRGELRREVFDLSGLARETAERLQKSNPERRVSLRIAEGIKANGDRNLARVILENLFDNAWKHTGQESAAVIEFGLEEVGGKPAYFVRDNGTGFANEQTGKLFKPFQSLPGSGQFAGKGIGLATVERIVRRHGGRAWAVGEPGKGATFYFTLAGP